MRSDYNAFSDIWKAHHTALYKYLLTRIGNQYDAEDVLQTTALKAASSFHLLKDKAKAKTWLFCIATNAMNDHFRERTKTTSLPQDYANTPSEEQQGYSDLKLSVDAYVAKLPLQRQSLFYIYVQGMFTIREIAKITGLGYSTARKWLNEMRADLSSLLADKNEQEPESGPLFTESEQEVWETAD